VSEQLLCALADLADPDAKGFVVNGMSVIVVRQGDVVKGYINDCPHRHLPLNQEPDRFLDFEGKFLLCSAHGALFSLINGDCLYGPCNGKRLKSVALVVRDGKVYPA